MDDEYSHQYQKDEDLIRSSQKLKKIYEKMYIETRKHYNLTQNEIDVLMFLKNHPLLDTSGDIARCQFLSRSLVSKSVESLLEKRYLMAGADRRDRRFVHLSLTGEADRILEELFQIRRKFWLILQQGIPVEDLNIFLRVLDQMDDNLNENFPET